MKYSPLRICFPPNYPSEAPRIFFTPPVFHPNIYPSGEVCSSILSSGWSSEFTISDLLLAIQSLLAEPNPASPANTEAFELFTTDPEAYDTRVRLIAKQLCIASKETVEACVERFFASENSKVDENVVIQ
jgi:ubiquitin-protein ligase